MSNEIKTMNKFISHTWNSCFGDVENVILLWVCVWVFFFIRFMLSGLVCSFALTSIVHWHTTFIYHIGHFMLSN